MKKTFVLLIFLSTIITQQSHAIRINEIHFNPSGYDNNLEFVEIYSDTKYDFTGYIVGDSSSNDTLVKLNNITNTTYSLIVEEGFNCSGFNISIYSAGLTIGNNLGNTEDTVYLYYPNNTQIDYVYYNSSFAEDGYSIELVNRTWTQSCLIGGSPGKENHHDCEQPSTSHDIMLEVYIEDIAYLNLELEKLFKITNLNSELGKAYDINVDYNITKSGSIIKQNSFVKDEVNQYSTTNTGEWFPDSVGNYTICGRITSSSVNDTNLANDVACKDVEVIDTSSIPCNISLNISTEKLVYENGESIKYYNNLNNESFPYIIEYWIEDLFKDIVKNKYNTTNTNQKTYTKTIDELDRAFVIRSRLVKIACNDSDTRDNSAKKYVIIKGTDISESNTTNNANITIEKIYAGSDDKLKWGECFRVKLKTYKNDTAKYSIQAYVENDEGEKLTKHTSKAGLHTKNTKYSLTLPLQLKPNCDEDYQDGTHTLVITGLAETETADIKIEGESSLCNDAENCESSRSSSGFDYRIQDAPLTAMPDEEIIVKVKLENKDDEDKDIKAHSYAYRGSKCYSGDRDANLQKISIKPGSSITLGLRIKLDKDIEPGDYKIMVKIKLDNQKTYKKITKNIIISEKGKINDFRLEQTANNSIKLVADITANKEYKVMLKSFMQEQEKDIEESDNLTFNAKAFEGPNTFFLLLKEDSEIIDIKELKIKSTDGSIQVLEKDTQLLGMRNIESPKTFSEKEKFDEPITIYKSSSKKSFENVMFFIATGLMALCVVLVIKAKNI